MEIGPEPVPVTGIARKAETSSGDCSIWLDGGVLACACPECGAPMSIRLWLMVADCFRCGASIELTDEQEQEALRLLREHEEARRADSRDAVAAISPTVLRKTKPRPADRLEPPAKPRPEAPSRAEPGVAPPAAPATIPSPRPRRLAASEVYRGARARVHEIYEKGGTAVFFGNLFRDLPAWLVSLVVHLVAMLLLGLWYEQPGDDSRSITLSTAVSWEDVEGDQGKVNQTEAFEFEDPGARELPNAISEPGAPTEESPDFRPVETPFEVPNPVGRLPGSIRRPTRPAPRTAAGRMFAGRDPEARAHAVEQGGGTSYTEAAVARGLKFLARHQNRDGSWSLHAFHRTPDCDETCRGEGHVHSDVAGTALSLLPFLGAGQTHVKGNYTNEVLRGLNWLVEHQQEGGDLRDGGQMYAHGQAAIALCEAYALTGDEQLREPAQMALNFILDAQHEQGGWRYTPGQAGDTSVVGWQLMALKSGQMAYLYVPSRTFEMAELFLDRVQTDSRGGRYAYQPRGNPTPAMTAEALLCRQYLGWPKDHPGLQAGVEFLLEQHPPDRKEANIYYWYYATQVMHHLGGAPWEKWNERMRQVLVDLQQTHGHAAGSWAPRGRGNPGGHADRGGRIYMTALAICILEVYYRHMPIYREEVLQGFE
ncbi:MAG: terpene cyclase/mutase family protein [Pirellulales bacterium]|nr:terpene cyclase/mutase family protein [Pirellulales bacterium]